MYGLSVVKKAYYKKSFFIFYIFTKFLTDFDVYLLHIHILYLYQTQWKQLIDNY